MRTVETTVLADFVREARATTGSLLAVGDVGASTVRFALVTGVEHGQTVQFLKFSNIRSVPNLHKVLEVIATALGDTVTRRITAGAIAVPGPVQDGERAVIANYKAETTEGRTIDARKLPSGLFPRAKTVVLNDVEAAGYGVIGLDTVGDLNIFRILWESGRAPRHDNAPLKALPKGNILVVAPGTGLGSCLIQYHPRAVGGGQAGTYSVLPLEFGHTNAPQHEETAFLDSYSQELGYAAEFDDVCTGRGLEFAYRFHSNGKRLTAPEISQLAKDGDDTASLAMRTYHQFIMSFCSQLTMGLLLSAIIICGDNVVSNGYYFERPANVDALRDQLLSHSMERMGFMSRPDVCLATQHINLNLIGCIYAAAATVKTPAKIQSKL
uniref:Glucokinase n=1 Tax=Neobodo designis TaxID=312471 RepID=A0A7S1L847_NEODS|mmetsp:Transcript_16792/g.52128  ORF Transcript_16792/g.52128 Transcript_16792/m.52128 type:complete len:382 (+) Transcript_16792:42-1187(+)